MILRVNLGYILYFSSMYIPINIRDAKVSEFFVACSQTLLPSLLGLPLQSVVLCMVEALTFQLDKEIKC
jgi:hypothetical protein